MLSICASQVLKIRPIPMLKSFVSWMFHPKAPLPPLVLNLVDESRPRSVSDCVDTDELKCYECLRTMDYELNKNKNPIRYPGTCEWFLKHPKYQTWLHESNSVWLWVTADPGCGKSVLSRFLVDEFMRLKSSQSHSVCYFFFKDDSDLTKSATQALCSILHQLFSDKPALLRKYAIDEFKKNGSKLPTLFEVLWRIFISAITDPEAGQVVCIFDALDECEESTRTPFVQKLAEFYNPSKLAAYLKLIITSRPNSQIYTSFWCPEWDLQSIRLMGENEAELEDISAEIKLVIEARVKHFKTRRKSAYHIEDDAHVVIQTALDEIQNRTYLWVALIFPELEKKANWPKLKLLEIIKTIPSTVDSAYERILSQSSNVELAKKLLNIVIAAKRPLTLSEMNVALFIDDTITSEAELESVLVPQNSFKSMVKDLCGLFITVLDSKIYLIHQTAKEFLLQPEETKLRPVNHVSSRPRIWKNSVCLSTAANVLGKACLQYLLLEELEQCTITLKHKVQSFRTLWRNLTMFTSYSIMLYSIGETTSEKLHFSFRPNFLNLR
jgi:hypothetical protein